MYVDGSNCTFMELKSMEVWARNDESGVQIVPLWNWNIVNTFIIIAVKKFKLYLYGIEIYR